jgi:hypothetical protein
MAYRSFADSLGRTWEVWTVVPTIAQRRRLARELTNQDQRDDAGAEAGLRPQWASGWLAFETPGEKRRLAPIPADWEEMSPTDLESLLRQATMVRPGRRLVE